MFGLNIHKVVTATVAIDATVSNAIHTAGAHHVLLGLPLYSGGLVTATCNVYVQGSNSATGTFRRLVTSDVYSAGAGTADWELPSGTGNKMVFCQPAAFVNYIKLEFSKTATAAYYPEVHLHW